MTVQGEGGVEWYRCPCDRCNDMVTRRKKPDADTDIICDQCRWVEAKGKPSTRVTRRNGQATYHTQCDRCGQEQRTPFLPKKDRKFLCDGCLRSEPQRDVRPYRNDVEVLGTKKDPLFWVTCDRCKNKVKLKFAPKKGDPFTCYACWEEDRARKQEKKAPPEPEKKEPEKHGTRIFFNIECVRCGKRETVDFVPRFPDEAICTSCFKSKKRRK